MPTLLVATQACHCGECSRVAELVIGAGVVKLRDPAAWSIRAVPREGAVEVRVWFRGCLERARRA